MKKIKSFFKKAEQNYWLTMLPLLALYIFIIFIKNDRLEGDEGRYWDYAGKLLQGEYASLDNNEYSYLWNGPGYPMILMPFRYADSPWIIPRLLNGFFIYFGLLLLFNSLNEYTSRLKALLLCIILGLYYPMLYASLPALMTEALCFFLICAIIYCVVYFKKDQRNIYLLLGGLCFGYLALTKVIFGYVLVVLGAIIFSVYVFRNKDKMLLSFGKLCLVAFLVCVPYLSYTYSVTGKLFYWGNSGGMNLYWMSTPYEEEYGDWFYFETLNEDRPLIYERHKDYLLSIKELSPLAKDEELKRKGVEQIMAHKAKFVKNWVANVSRIFLGQPHSYNYQSNNHLYYLLPNSLLILALIVALVLSVFNYKRITVEAYFIVGVALIYLGGVSLLSALIRFLYPIIPLLIFGIVYIFERFIIISKGFNGAYNIQFLISKK